MFFSKSFGYALRGVLYIALMHDQKQYVQVEEIASTLAVPRHFMGKILKNLSKKKVLLSVKGPSGGFSLNEHTLQMQLMLLVEITDGMQGFNSCVLRVRKCSPSNPCPMHRQMEEVKMKLKSILTDTTIGDLLGKNDEDFIRSISTNTETGLQLSNPELMNK
jgi:Rrf2 family iron-sulfur cluster assembly transcriptional regulator